MNIYLSIDDTDNLESPGSGQLSEILAQELQTAGLARQCSNITRHQLFYHTDIPYTSHNSAMCFSADIVDTALDDVILFAQNFLQNSSAPGSDPGLCVSSSNDCLDKAGLTDFGLRAKREIVTKEEAYSLAAKSGVHLSEHGGTGDGVIGALAGTGLRLLGNDGRFRGWLKLGKAGQVRSAQQLCAHASVDAVVHDFSSILNDDTLIMLADDKIKTVCVNYQQVIPVKKISETSGCFYRTLTKSEVKSF